MLEPVYLVSVGYLYSFTTISEYPFVSRSISPAGAQITSEQWRILGRAYYTMEELGILEQNHYKLFQAIHDAGTDLSTVDRLARWIDGGDSGWLP